MKSCPIEIDFDYQVEDYKKVNGEYQVHKASLGVFVKYDELNPQDFTMRIFNELGNQDITKEVKALNLETYDEIEAIAKVKMLQHSIDEDNNQDFVEAI